ncbi:MAG: DUF3169 family protein [Lachnospiraceae bacterium]|nr:DUF3169 family protein [Lachnospiraceae bacterium]
MNQEVKRIKQEDKKALKGFSIWMIAALIIGVLAGMMTSLAEFFFADDIVSILTGFMQNIVLPYGMPVVTAIILIVVVVLYNKGKKMFLSWDGDDEEVMDKAEEYLSYAVWLTSMNMIWLYFIFGATFTGDMWEELKYNDGSFSTLVWTLLFFILGLVVVSVEQQKLVNLTKQINPEKQGSVFDTKFQKKWEASCDEAEKLQIYKCAFKAYNVVQIECVVLWLLCLMGGFIWDFGILPIALITIIWGTMTTVYCFESIRLSKKGGK